MSSGIKNKCFVLALITWVSLSSNVQATIAAKLTDLKIDSKWRIKFDQKEWSYSYLKPYRAISSDIFEHKKEKIKMILQKEDHHDAIHDEQALIEKKCSEANSIYTQKAEGKAELLTINQKKVCYLEIQTGKGNVFAQIVYPEMGWGDNYRLYSYGWDAKNKNGKKVVTQFLKGFLR